MQHAISWFEIPTTDLERATRFYESIFQAAFFPMDMPGLKMRVFPTPQEPGTVGGALVHSEDGFHTPHSHEGVLIYLNANPDVQVILERVEKLGNYTGTQNSGKPEIGHIGVFLDTEGNRIGLHAVPPQTS